MRSRGVQDNMPAFHVRCECRHDVAKLRVRNAEDDELAGRGVDKQ